MTEAKLLSESEVDALHRRAIAGPLLLPLRAEGWHQSLSDGGHYIRQSTGRIFMTVAFVEAERYSKPAIDGNAPARAVVELLNAIPALCATVKALRDERSRMLSALEQAQQDRNSWRRTSETLETEKQALQSQLAAAEQERDELRAQLTEAEALLKDCGWTRMPAELEKL